MRLRCYHPYQGCYKLMKFIDDSIPLTVSSSRNRAKYAIFHAKRGRCIYYKKCPLAQRFFNSRTLFD